MKKNLIIVVNVLIVLAIVAFVVLYTSNDARTTLDAPGGRLPGHDRGHGARDHQLPGERAARVQLLGELHQQRAVWSRRRPSSICGPA